MRVEEDTKLFQHAIVSRGVAWLVVPPHIRVHLNQVKMHI
jgi:hypothetical protein